VWPADVLVIALASDQEATCWIPEEGNVTTSVVLDDILDLHEVMLPVPPLDHDFISPSSPPPPYEQAVSSTQLYDVIEIISDDEGDVKVKVKATRTSVHVRVHQSVVTVDATR